MKKTFETEADIRNFKSKVLLLPRKLLLEINQQIDQGKREWAICNYIRKNYKGTLGTPTEPTVRTYVDWYEAKKKIVGVHPSTATDLAILEKEEVIDVTKECQAILDGNTDISNKKELLEKLIKKCIQRMRNIESVQETEGVTASLEQVIGHYMKEIHNLTVTQLKLSGELQEETNEAITKIIQENLFLVIQIMFRVLRKVVPDQTESIQKEFYEEIQANKQLCDIPFK